MQPLCTGDFISFTDHVIKAPTHAAPGGGVTYEFLRAVYSILYMLIFSLDMFSGFPGIIMHPVTFKSAPGVFYEFEQVRYFYAVGGGD